jgi:hypothetical protein
MFNVYFFAGVDAVALREGWISVTPLGLDWDSADGLKAIKDFGF